MKNYVELLTSERAALAEKYRAKPRCATLRERYFWANAIAFDVTIGIQNYDVDSYFWPEAAERAEKALKRMKTLSAALDRDSYVAGPAATKAWMATLLPFVEA
jgi:hypothetical protein